jgi:endonuclease YncB( thermonuclease family)
MIPLPRCRRFIPAYVATAVACAAVNTGAAGQSPAAAPCRPESPLTRTVASVGAGPTIVLAGGEEAKLAAIEMPRMPARARSRASDATEDGAAAAEAARAALAGMVLGREVLLQPLAAAPDRYGRLLVRAFTAGSETAPQSVEIRLLAQGFAYAAPLGGDARCRAALLTAERAARAAKLGLWGDSYYELRFADDPANLSGVRGRFAVVEGRVASVRESGGTVYVNFGRRWSEDFTVTILKRNERLFTAAGLDLKKLAGQRVLVRGWIEERGGPWIEATMPEQIEIAARR